MPCISSVRYSCPLRRTMTGKRIYTGLMGLLLFLAFACTDDRESPGGTNGNPSLVFRMTRASADIINNTQVYLFDGDGATAGQFRQKVPDVTYAADRLTMPVAAGILHWLVLTEM